MKHRKIVHQSKLVSRQNGSNRSVRKGRGMEFSEVRQYQAGDDIRHIDWRVSARTQITHTKVFTEEHDRPVLCVLAQTPDLFFGSTIRFKTDQGLRVLSALAWSTLNRGDKVGGYIFNPQQDFWIDPKQQKHAVLSLLNAGITCQTHLTKSSIIAQQQNPNTDYWLPALQKLQNKSKPGQKLFLIGHFLTLSETEFTIISNLKRRLDINLIQLVDQLEMTLPDIGWVRVTNGADETLLNSQNNDTRSAYQEAYQAQWEATQSRFHQLRIPIITIQAQDDTVGRLVSEGILT